MNLRLMVFFLVGLAVVVFFLSACASGPLSTREKGALVGGAGGAGVGAIVGGGKGAAIGSVLGALGGVLMGDQFQKREQVDAAQQRQLDYQRRELERQRREIERLRQGGGNQY